MLAATSTVVVPMVLGLISARTIMVCPRDTDTVSPSSSPTIVLGRD